MMTRKAQFAGFCILVSAGILYHLWSQVSFAEVFGTIQRIPPSWFVFFVFYSIVMSSFRTWRYHLLLGASGYSPRLSALFLITLVRNFFSDLLPARLGTLIYVYLIRTRLNIALGPAFSSFAYCFLFDLISLSLIVLPVVLIAGFSIRSALVFAGIGLLLGVVSFSIVYFLPLLCDRTVHRIRSKIGGVGGYVEKFSDLLSDTAEHLRFSRSKGIYWKVLALSAAVRLCKYISMYFLLVGLVVPFGYSLEEFPFLRVFPGMCSAEMAASLPISGIAGFGLYEGAWALVFQLLGYPEKIAILTSLSHHLITQVYGYSLGAVALLVLLLPIFAPGQRQPGSDRRLAGKFWLKFCTLSFAVGGGALLILTAGSGRSDELITVPLKKVTVVEDAMFPVQGRLVYEREEGIAVKYLASNRSELIVPGGRYPRWTPDGNGFGCIVGKSILYVDLETGMRRVLAEPEKPGALVFTTSSLIYSDGNQLKQVALDTEIETVLPVKGRLLELDIDRKESVLAATRKTLTGYNVDVYYLPEFTRRSSVAGCSASLSPDGRLVTVNSRSHRKLFLYSVAKNTKKKVLHSTRPQRYDNQLWTNHPDWIVVTAEGEDHDIVLQSVLDGSLWPLTCNGDSDRGDLFITDQ